MGFLETWEKKGHESDRSFYLEAWNGSKPYTIDRIGRGTVHAANICVSTACCDYLESHARRIYGMVLESSFEAFPSVSKAEELLAWIKKQSHSSGQPLKRRFILRYSKFRSSKEPDPLLSDLVQIGYIKTCDESTFSLVSQSNQ